MPKTLPNISVGITRSPLTLVPVLRRLTDPFSGGVAIFVGRVRQEGRGRGASRGTARTVLEYEAYRPLALRELRRIATVASKRHDARAIVIRHRVGKLDVGEVSVIVAVACPHRNEAFLACRYLIDTLKTDVPIWKTSKSDNRS